jgi:hypothetical protein
VAYLTNTNTLPGNLRGLRSRTAVRGSIAALATRVALGRLGILLLLAGVRWATPATLAGPVGDGAWTARTRAWFASDGFYSPELEQDSARQFSWTGQTARLDIPRLNRSQAHRLSVNVAAPRPPDVPSPRLSLAVDGVVLVRADLSGDRQRVAVNIPPRRADGTVVTLQVSSTFVPGPQDRRPLGVLVDDVGLTSATGRFRPSAYVVALAGLAAMACALGLILCGLRSRWGLLAPVAVVVVLTWLLLVDGAFIGTYVERLVSVGAGVVLIGAIVAIARWRWPVVAGLPEWSIAIGLVLGACAVKLALFAHPLATIGDAIFQVHRAQMVHGGNYFFTSITPRPFFEFPYPIALYVAAQPFWRFFPSELDLVRLLRGLTLAADALVGLALYAAARRQWNDRVAALLCAVLWPLARAPFEGLSNANLTNVFGQGIFGVAMGVIAWTAAGQRTSIGALLAACGLLVVAFLSHFGTVSAGVPILCAVGVVLWAGGRAHVHRLGAWVLVVALAATALSYVVYYSHFTAVYRTTIARVLSREGEAPTRSMVAPPAIRFRRWIAGGTDDYGLPGLPILAAALAGSVLLARRRRREGVTLVLAGWALVWAVFAVLGIFSAFTVRVNLATAPVFVCLCAYALGFLWAKSRLGAALAVAGTLVITWDGLRIALMCLGLNPLL